ncbi:hypothetical protein EMIT0347P_90006 [Pseudomonas sp. IT-347P]
MNSSGCVADAAIVQGRPAYFQPDANPRVGVSLLAIAVGQSDIYQLTHRYRERAHSYKGGVWNSEIFISQK